MLFRTRESIHVQAIKPEINAAIKPSPSVVKFADSEKRSPLTRSFPIFPKIKGTTIKKENRAALLLSFPNNTEVDIVAPLLEIPGSIAMACEIPMMNALLKVTALPVYFALSASHKRIAVTINIAPTKAMLPPKKLSSCSSKRSPITTAGNMETIILVTNCVSSFHVNFKRPLSSSQTSFLKTTNVLNAVAK